MLLPCDTVSKNMNLQIDNYQDYCNYTNTCALCDSKLHQKRIEYMDGNSMSEDIITIGHLPGCNGVTNNHKPFLGIQHTQEDIDEIEEKHWMIQREIQENGWDR